MGAAFALGQLVGGGAIDSELVARVIETVVFF